MPPRFQRLSSYLLSVNCQALLVEHPTDLLYLTHLELSAGKLLVTQEDSFLFVDGRYYETCLAHSPCPVYHLEEFSLKEWLQKLSIQSVGFDSSQTTYKTFLQRQQDIEDTEIRLVPLDAPVQTLRLIKDEEEIAILREAACLGYEGYEFVVSQLREGVTEIELALELEFFWKKRGAKRLAFDSIIAFGPNSSMPHYRAGTTPLTPNVPVLIDIGLNWKHYHSDMTRVVFFGDPDHKIKEIYQIVDEAKELALSLCRPGTLIGELDQAARDYIADYGYREYFTHSLGHGIGLDVHEMPIIRSKGAYSTIPLQKGMAITIEPGIYLPGLGGVRLEDTVLITEHGFENLTHL